MRTYISPSIRVIELSQETELLTGSEVTLPIDGGNVDDSDKSRREGVLDFENSWNEW